MSMHFSGLGATAESLASGLQEMPDVCREQHEAAIRTAMACGVPDSQIAARIFEYRNLAFISCDGGPLSRLLQPDCDAVRAVREDVDEGAPPSNLARLIVFTGIAGFAMLGFGLYLAVRK